MFGLFCYSNLSGLNLEGEISPAIGNLKDLTFREIVSLARYLMRLGDCSSLQDLDLSFNEINGDIPFSISKLKQLELLVLKNNQLIGPIPLTLSQIPNLKVLDLGAETDSVGEIRQGLLYWKTKFWQYLDLSFNQLTGEIPFNIGFLQIATLYVLAMHLYLVYRLSFNGRISSLSTILTTDCDARSLQGNQLTGKIPPVIGLMQALAVLDLSCNMLSGPIPPILGNLTYTEKLGGEVENGGVAGGRNVGSVAESLAKRLSECGFEAKKRVSGSGVAENVKMWEDMIKKKELIVKSRNSVLFAWTLVACVVDLMLFIFCTLSGFTLVMDGPLRIEALSFGSDSTISSIICMVEDAQGNEVPIQRLADSIAGPFVYSVMTISAVTFSFWYYTGSHFFPDVLLNDIAGPDGDPLLLSLKLSVDVLTGTLTEGKPAVSAVSSISYEESEILQMADAVEKTALHPIARAIVNKAESLKLTIPVTRGQLTEPGFGTLAEVDGSLVAVGSLDWVQERFQRRTGMSDLKDLETEVMYQSSEGMSSSSYSKTVVYVGREGEGIIGAIAISNGLCHDAESTVIRTILAMHNAPDVFLLPLSMVGSSITVINMVPLIRRQRSSCNHSKKGLE
ncbi:hypothetical protein NC652_017523 [Populus alba x Populus x berolinensis]|nr:hypothetical protein NC652_017523 [Populus alba x Populus x berolinensis]